MALQERIATLLERRPGVKPVELSRIAGVSSASVSDWMTGATKTMKPEPARRLSVAFGCDQNWLMTGIGVPAWKDAPQINAEGAPPEERPTSRQALASIRQLLLKGTHEQNERVGEALKLMAAVPDSDRAFEQAVSLLTSIK